MRKFTSLFIVTLFIFPIGGASFIEDPILQPSIPPNLGASAEESYSTPQLKKVMILFLQRLLPFQLVRVR